MRIFEQLRERGVRVRVLTNSLASNDVPIVHAGYARYRKTLLRAGVELYEFKRSARALDRASTLDLGDVLEAGLHSKVYIFDRRKTFVGSFNLDPRSRHINTELGILFDDAAFSELLAARFDQVIDRIAFRLQLQEPEEEEEGQVDAGYGLEWIDIREGDEVRSYSEPDAGFWRLIAVWLLSLLPIEGQL